MKVKLFIVLAFVSFFLISCDFSSIKKRDNITELNGFWTGTQTIDGTTTDVELISYNNNFYGFSEVAGVMFSGIGSISKKNFNASYNLYTLDTGVKFGTGDINGYTEKDNKIYGDIKNSLGQYGQFKMKIDKNNLHTTPKIKTIATTYHINNRGTLIINNMGKAEGNIDGCSIDGKIIIPDENINIYDVSFRLSNCEYSGYYHGIATVIDRDNNKYLYIGSSNNQYMNFLHIKIP